MLRTIVAQGSGRDGWWHLLAHSLLWASAWVSASVAHGAARVLALVLGQPITKGEQTKMLRFTLSYARYVLTALSTVAFQIVLN